MKRILQRGMVVAGLLVLVGSPLFARTLDLTDQSGVKEIEISSRGMAYDLTEIRVNRGDRLRVTYRNGGGRHDWRVDEFEGAATRVLGAGRSETVEFVVDRAGTFEFYCSVPGHRQAGMYGRLIVEE
ncbi:plastocyanin/azurin family copper-binding protein [Alkalispirochaeta alkalica]|uniref:plastocyanin/azurin family copper-binding protein n=1 Tax=Alkalispirochaeta alkalica TaxID=46356 RepID=UPI000A0422FC|nr:plastocyanin/azurin family copper-binding protein [Alkalispirochaeta alkalica]